MVDDAKLGKHGFELGQHLGRVVGASIIDDDDLVTFRERARGETCPDDHARDSAGIVVGRENHRKLDGVFLAALSLGHWMPLNYSATEKRTTGT